ncbi:MAG: hypothetical protein NDJ89_04480 [Oligoflexia bacterium]|nr:hypothetical protein [Oligoflexia bacterium]
MRFRLLLLSLTSLSLSGFGSCSSSVSELCVSGFPRTERDFEQARAALSAPGTGRALASLSHGEFDREHWLDWAESRINEVQDFMDVAERDPRFRELRKELSLLADQLVSFHGYAAAGNRERMSILLDRALARGRKVRSLACEPAPPIGQR